jgi:CRP-like cAMP-binding protein
VYGDRNIAFKNVLQGAYWGEVELVDMIPREYSLMTEQWSDLLVMSKSLFEAMVSEFPAVAQKVRDTALIRRAKTQECLNEVLDIYETVEVRKQARLEELAGKERVEFGKAPGDEDVGRAVAEMMAGRTDEEVAVWLRREMAVMALEVEVRFT